jgi:hypothetical protein
LERAEKALDFLGKLEKMEHVSRLIELLVIQG